MPRLAHVTPRISTDLRRGASVVALLAIAAIGLRSRAGLSSASRPAAVAALGHVFGAVFGAIVGLAAVACLALLVFIFRGRRGKRSPEDDRAEQDLMLPWWSRVLAMLAALALVAVPIVLLVLVARGHRQNPTLLPASGRLPVFPTTPASHMATGGSLWLLAGGLAAVGVAAIWLALSSWRRSRLPGLETTGADPAAASLAAAMSAGTAALHSHDDPRTAIIACYAAMERSLSGAGSPPAAADTPAEVLDRAAASGLVRSAAADALTRLFRRARYSDHALAADDRTAALSALAGLRADLGESGLPGFRGSGFQAGRGGQTHSPTDIGNDR